MAQSTYARASQLGGRLPWVCPQGPSWLEEALENGGARPAWTLAALGGALSGAAHGPPGPVQPL